LKKAFLLFFFLPCVLRADEVYFSPKGHVREQILQRIRHCRSTLDIAMYSLTSRDIAEALKEAARRGVKVRVIRDISQTKETGDADAYLGGTEVEVRLLKGIGRGIMHDKFAVFDGKEGFTGSYNWTQNAELDNYENAFFFTGPQILYAYEKEFARLWDIAQPIAISGQTPSAMPGLLHNHPALSVFGLFVILLAVAAALAT
jgi:phosphatidylserine/phosphatidylglycerophosphate/cardiolipin synthase-like enzyme